MNIENPIFMDYFLAFSALATGYTQFDLQGTGQAQLYLETVNNAVGDKKLGQLLKHFNDEGVHAVLASDAYGAIARNIIKLWYIATWDALGEFGQTPENATRIVAPQAYTEGLVWPTVGVNPPAAKAQGYASWSTEPRIRLT